MKFAVVFLCLAILARPALAESDLSAAVSQAAENIGEAGQLLEQASGAEDQVLALGAAITAYENGLRVLRDSLRTATLRELALARDYALKRDDFTRILGTLYTMESRSSPLLFLHPGGALAAAQSAQLLAEATPVLRSEAEALRLQISELAALRSLRDTASANLRDGLAALLNARAALDDAIARGDPVPALFVEDRMQVQILAATSASLADFAGELERLPLPGFESVQISSAETGLPLPVAGVVLHGFNESDASGLRRPGMVIEAAPLSLVTTPFDATIRFAGPFLDYGNVAILEPQAGKLLILAGIGRLMRAEGDVLTQGDPVGQLGGTETTSEEFLIEASQETGVQVRQTLYIELRKDGEPVDPAPWFKQD